MNFTNAGIIPTLREKQEREKQNRKSIKYGAPGNTFHFCSTIPSVSTIDMNLLEKSLTTSSKPVS